MAYRSTAADIEAEVLRISGYDNSAEAPWGSTDALIAKMNLYGQRLPRRLAQVAKNLGVVGAQATPRFDMWRTVGTLTTSSGSSTAWFPEAYDHFISFWDETNSAKVEPIENVDKYFTAVRTQPAGPPEYIEILGFALNSTTWQRKATLWPPTAAATTPNITLTYWRLPAQLDDPTDMPDTDPKFADLWVYGTALEISRPTDPHYSNYVKLEGELLTEAALTARAL